jgi:hypothetical protein
MISLLYIFLNIALAYPNIQQTKLLSLIDNFAINSNKFPFHDHAHYFSNDNKTITSCSIGNKWKQLSKENILLTKIKGYITIRAANHVNQREKPGCPYTSQFDAIKITQLLKHPSDSGIVNANGSINKEALTNMMLTSFEYDNVYDIYYLRKSTITKLLTSWSNRDINKDKYLGFLMPNSDTVAKFEWDDFFLNYVDYWVLNESNSQPAVTATTFLQFYYMPSILYNRVLNGELPITKNKMFYHTYC